MNESIRAGQQMWSYMASEVFQNRYLVAANYLRNCSHILEVGACSTPITRYLRGAHESVTVVDPLVEPVHLFSGRAHAGHPVMAASAVAFPADLDRRFWQTYSDRLAACCPD